MKHYVTINIKFSRFYLKATIPFVIGTVAHKNTFFRTKLEPVIIVGSEIGKAGATKNAKNL
jgi:hypothetical protein